MTEKRFRFVPAKCIVLNRPKVCPVEEGLKFTAVLDENDGYQVKQVDHLGVTLAACPECGSHKSVEEI